MWGHCVYQLCHKRCCTREMMNCSAEPVNFRNSSSKFLQTWRNDVFKQRIFRSLHGKIRVSIVLTSLTCWLLPWFLWTNQNHTEQVACFVCVLRFLLTTRSRTKTRGSSLYNNQCTHVGQTHATVNQLVNRDLRAGWYHQLPWCRMPIPCSLRTAPQSVGLDLICASDLPRTFVRHLSIGVCRNLPGKWRWACLAGGWIFELLPSAAPIAGGFGRLCTSDFRYWRKKPVCV